MRHIIQVSVVLAVSVVFGTGAAMATEPLQLTCDAIDPVPTASNTANYLGTLKVRVDFDNPNVAFTYPGGLPIASTTDQTWNASAPSVRITDGLIHWVLENTGGFIFQGSLDRETGKINSFWLERRGGIKIRQFYGSCRRATQKF